MEAKKELDRDPYLQHNRKSMEIAPDQDYTKKVNNGGFPDLTQKRRINQSYDFSANNSVRSSGLGLQPTGFPDAYN